MTTSPQSMSDLRYAVVSALEYIDAGDAEQAMDMIRSLCRATAEQAGKLEGDWQQIAHLIGSIFFYGGFRAETYNERELESLLRKVGCFYETEAALLAKPTQPAAPDDECDVCAIGSAYAEDGGVCQCNEAKPAATQMPVASLWLRKIDVTMIQAAREGGMEMVSVMAKLAPEAGWTEPFTVSTAEGCDACMPYGLHGKETCPQCGRVLAAPVSPSREVEALVAKWREAESHGRKMARPPTKPDSIEWWNAYADTKMECANELEAALAPVQEKAP